MNNVLKNILKVCGVVGLVCLLTVLCCLPFFNFKDNKTVANAVELQPMDSVVSYDLFTSNNILVPTGLCNSTSLGSLINKYGFLGFQFRVFSDGESLTCSYKINSLFFSNINSNSDDLLYVDHQNINDFIDLNISFNTWENKFLRIYPCYASEILSFNPNDINTFPDIIASPSFYCPFFCFCEIGFTSNLSAITITYANGIAGSYQGVDIKFIDNNDKFFRIQLPCLSSSIPNTLLNDLTPSRTIFLQQNLSDNSYYNSGLVEGFRQGESSGYDLGYDDGFDDGESVGYYNGKQDGANEANTYTFGYLMTSVIDAPVSVFISMLDFNIMGFNILNLVVGLLTLAIVCLVVKLLLGGK